MTGLGDSADKTVVVYQEGPGGDGGGVLPAIEATLRHAAEAFQVVVVRSRSELDVCLRSADPVLIVIDADRLDAAALERSVAVVRADPGRGWVPVLAMVDASNLAVLGEILGLPLVDFIVKPFASEELWGRVRVALHQAGVVARLERERDELSRRAMTDGLTGLDNAACILERCERELSRARRYGQPLSCLLIDIDNFKAVNDSYGHPVGNEVLRGLAQLLRQSVRGSDAVGRYGGEEFLLLLPQTDQSGAMALGERLRRTIEKHSFKVGLAVVRVTVSIGVATFPSRGVMGRETLFLAVDRAVYRAKSLGRNQVACLEQENGPLDEGESAVGRR